MYHPEKATPGKIIPPQSNCMEDTAVMKRMKEKTSEVVTMLQHQS
jgi:hypothetical protein